VAILSVGLSPNKRSWRIRRYSAAGLKRFAHPWLAYRPCRRPKLFARRCAFRHSESAVAEPLLHHESCGRCSDGGSPKSKPTGNVFRNRSFPAAADALGGRSAESARVCASEHRRPTTFTRHQCVGCPTHDYPPPLRLRRAWRRSFALFLALGGAGCSRVPVAVSDCTAYVVHPNIPGQNHAYVGYRFQLTNETDSKMAAVRIWFKSSKGDYPGVADYQHVIQPHSAATLRLLSAKLAAQHFSNAAIACKPQSVLFSDGSAWQIRPGVAAPQASVAASN